MHIMRSDHLALSRDPLLFLYTLPLFFLLQRYPIRLLFLAPLAFFSIVLAFIVIIVVVVILIVVIIIIIVIVIIVVVFLIAVVLLVLLIDAISTKRTNT